jgi:ribulose-5-phosphate 4-epimerase/fuculose-1-phosphate aldolase
MTVSTTAAKKPNIGAEEWKTRVDLAAAFRLCASWGFDELLFAHISARVPGEPSHYLFHAAALLFEEVTASNLHKLDERGEHVIPSEEVQHRFAFPFHKGVYDACPEANCVLHLHTKAATAVAMQEQGLIPGNQYALWLGKVGYHPYEGLVSTPEEGLRLAKAFEGTQIVVQKGHGIVLWGRSVHEAFMMGFLLNRACEVQIASMTGGVAPYVPPQSVIDVSPVQARIITSGDAPFNKMTWAALLRKLDREQPDYKT